ncbi:GSCOCG00009066001-RA-CDS, partial [Cotesia congregata]
FSSEIRSQIYEDEANLAMVTLDFNSSYGFFTTKNITFTELQDDSPKNFSIVSRKQLFLARRMYGEILDKFGDKSYDKFGEPLIIDGLSYQPASKIPIPDVIYPEILITVDYNFYKRFNKETIIPYLFSFWSGVDMFYRQLQNPKYKLSIAGVVIAEDFQVLHFMIPERNNKTFTMSINFMNVISGDMPKWLSVNASEIALSSYDIQMLMTPYIYEFENKNGEVLTFVGLSSRTSACYGQTHLSPLGGVISEPHNFQGVLRAVHELGHIFGSAHDLSCENSSCEKQYLMASQENFWTITRFSETTINNFHRALEENDFSCMYNKANVDKPLHMILDEDDRLVTSKQKFAADKVIKIYYEDDTLIVTQVNTDKSSVAEKLDDSFLKIVVTDDNVLEVNPDEISQLSKVNIYHEDQFIYAYQGRKPVPENYNDVLESNPEDLSPDYFENDDTEMCFNKTDFDSDKLVKIYYENNKIHVSQRNVPDCESPNERKSSYLQYIGSELGIIYLYLTEINWDKEVCVQHDDASIFVYQGEKPDLDRWEYNSGKIKYLPDESYVNRKLPESEERKQRSEFNLTLDTEHTLSIFPNEFNQKKLVSISFENDKLIISQIGTPEENRVEENMLSEDANVMFFTRDVNKLLLHPVRLTSRKEIHIRHVNKIIKIWQGSYDSPPDLSFNNLDVIEIITR